MNVQFHWNFWAKSWKFSDLRFLYGFLKPLGRGVWFSSFLLYSVPYSNWTRNCKKLREFKEIETQCNAVELTANSKKENFKTFVWIYPRIRSLCTGAGPCWSLARKCKNGEYFFFKVSQMKLLFMNWHYRTVYSLFCTLQIRTLLSCTICYSGPGFIYA